MVRTGDTLSISIRTPIFITGRDGCLSQCVHMAWDTNYALQNLIAHKVSLETERIHDVAVAVVLLNFVSSSSFSTPTLETRLNWGLFHPADHTSIAKQVAKIRCRERIPYIIASHTQLHAHYPPHNLAQAWQLFFPVVKPERASPSNTRKSVVSPPHESNPLCTLPSHWGAFTYGPT